MILKLSKSSAFTNAPFKSKYRTPDGRDMYRVSTPWESFTRTTAIKKVSSSRRDIGDEIDIARIEFHTLRSNVMYFNGREYDFGSFFEKTSITLNGWKKSFFGPGGVRYVWKPLWGHDYELYTKLGERKTVIGYFTYKTFGHSTLEIFLPPEDEMCDWVLVTFLCVYQEHHHHHTAGGPAGATTTSMGPR